MTNCAVKNCRNTSSKQRKSDEITYHNFPVDPVIAHRWIQRIRLNRGETRWTPKKNTKICSNHFRKKDKYLTKKGMCKIRRGAVPSKRLYLYSSESDSQSRDSEEPTAQPSKFCIEINTTEPYHRYTPATTVSDVQVMPINPADRSLNAAIKVEPQEEVFTETTFTQEHSTCVGQPLDANPEGGMDIRIASVNIKVEKGTDDFSEHVYGTHLEAGNSSQGHIEQSQPLNMTAVGQLDPLITNTFIKTENEGKVFTGATFYTQPQTNTFMGQPLNVTPVHQHGLMVSNSLMNNNKAPQLFTLNTSCTQSQHKVNSSDSDSNWDTPEENKLRRKLRRKTALQEKHTRLIKTLKQKLRRLKNKNMSLKRIIATLKKERVVKNKRTHTQQTHAHTHTPTHSHIPKGRKRKAPGALNGASKCDGGTDVDVHESLLTPLISIHESTDATVNMHTDEMKASCFLKSVKKESLSDNLSTNSPSIESSPHQSQYSPIFFAGHPLNEPSI